MSDISSKFPIPQNSEEVFNQPHNLWFKYGLPALVMACYMLFKQSVRLHLRNKGNYLTYIEN